jgi:hypothetical protein
VTSERNVTEFISARIDVYKEHICLWNVEDKAHSNKDFRDKAHEQVLSFSNDICATTMMCVSLDA